METLQNIIQQHGAMAVVVVVILVAVAGLILRKLQLLSVIIILVCSAIIYLLLQSGHTKAPSLEKLKHDTKERVMRKIR
jgi:Na+/H+ antiporter NhaC